MGKLIKIFEFYRVSFFQELERKARKILAKLNWDNDFTGIAGSLELTLEEIEGQRRLRKKFDDELRQAEFYTYLDIKRAKREIQYTAYFERRVDSLKNILMTISRERRGMEAQNNEATSRLFERLLAILNQHEKAIAVYQMAR